MLVANFTRKDEEIEVKGLWMYDYGQKLQINGLNLPNIFEVHFKWRGLEKAKVVTGITHDGVSSVDIPNEALSQNGAITAYLYLSTPEEGQTVNTAIMYLERRIAPEGFEIPEDVDLFHHTLIAVDEYSKRAKKSETVANEKAIESESWAHGHSKYPERNKDNAKYYSEQAKQVATFNGFCHMEIREDGHLYLTRTDNLLQNLNFKINNGRLEVEMT